MAGTKATGGLVADGPALTTRTALAIPVGMSIGAWRQLGQRIFAISDSAAWWLGDWLIYGQNRFPDRYRRAIEQTSLDYQTLRNYGWIARRFPPRQRREGLSFQHHAEVAGLPPDERDQWLDRAEQLGWSRNELRRRLRAHRRGDDGDADEVVHLQVEVTPDRRGRWQAAADRAGQQLSSWVVTVLDRAAATAPSPEATPRGDATP